MIRDNFICATSATSKRAQPIFSKITFLRSLGPMEKNELYLVFIVTKKIKLVLKGGVLIGSLCFTCDQKLKLKKFHPKFCGCSLLLSQKSVGACTPCTPSNASTEKDKTHLFKWKKMREAKQVLSFYYLCSK